MTTDMHWVHRQAGLAIQFEWQDKCIETGDCAELDSTSIIGKLPDQDVWIVACNLTATDGVADGEYWWPVTNYLAVYQREDGTPSSRHATEQELALFPEDDGDEDEEEEEDES
jgi:hypothetical protein